MSSILLTDAARTGSFSFSLVRITCMISVVSPSCCASHLAYATVIRQRWDPANQGTMGSRQRWDPANHVCMSPLDFLGLQAMPSTAIATIA